VGISLQKIFLVGLILSVSFSSTVSAVATPKEETGMSTGTTLIWVSSAELDARLADIKASGAEWVRIDFSWQAIQPDGYNDYRWEQYDRVVNAVTARNLKVLAVLTYTPKWAREPRCQKLTQSDRCNPRSNKEFARFARASVLRYRDKGLHTWEIWNEPNLTGHWKTALPNKHIIADPAAYARMATAAAKEIRRHDSKSYIVTGGLAPMFEPTPLRGVRQSDYLAKMLPLLDRKLFNAIAIHPYSWPKMPATTANWNAFYTVNNGPSKYNLRKVMSRYGWGDKPIWGTEFGASTQGKRIKMARNGARPDHVSEYTQAAIIKQGVEHWYKKPKVGPIFVHSDSDEWLPERKNEGGFGLRRENGTKKPAYDAFQHVNQQL
jgi:hypothetical protein